VTRSHPYYPLFLDLEGRDVVIVGGGGVAARKAASLLTYGARVTVVAPAFVPELEAAGVALRRRAYEPGDLEGAALVIAATDDAAINASVAAECRRRDILVNVVDDTALCDFIVPAVVESGSIQLAVSTGGQSPALARRLKDDLQHALGPEYAEVNDILGSLRDNAKVSPSLPADADRKRFFDGILELGVIELLRDGHRREAYEAVAEACRAADVRLSALVLARLAKL
jgi:precorrin-2 dehydrogenase/sirohydrochlorin ferrochelatase